MKIQIRKFYEPAPGATGGKLTLSDLNAGDPAPAAPAPQATPTIDPEAVRLEAERLAKEAAEKNKPSVEGLNEDGTLQEGYIKDENGNVIKDPAAAPAEPETQTDGVDPEAFWEDVNKRHGWEGFKVDYPEGIDPLSPEGAYVREKAITVKAQDDFETFLKQTDPRSYAYMLHRHAGGSDEDFFAEKTFTLPEYSEFKENIDLQTAVYRESLKSKGLDSDTVQLIIDKAVKDKKLFDNANAAYKAVEEDQQKQLQVIETRRQQAAQAYEQSVNRLNVQLNEAVVEGKGISLVIPDTDKQPFLNFIKQRVQVEDGKFVIVQPIDNDLHKQLESLFFLYKKGDLKSLVAREAKTQNVARLGQAVQKSKTAGNSGGGESPKSKKLTLGAL